MIAVSDLSEAEREMLVHILHDSAKIKRHSELFLWLQGDLQRFLPHDILIAISGDFSGENLSFDVVSGLPGIRTDNLSTCNVQKFSRQLHAIWLLNGKQMFSTDLGDELPLCAGCSNTSHTSCEPKKAMQDMKSVLVHCIRDERHNTDVLYAILHGRSHAEWRYKSMFELMAPHIDVASRRIVGLPIASTQHLTMKRAHAELMRIGISQREQDVLEWVTMGKTNYEIGIILNISAFTVKNHLQRIFKKLDVINRIQAVAKMKSLSQNFRSAATS